MSEQLEQSSKDKYYNDIERVEHIESLKRDLKGASSLVERLEMLLADDEKSKYLTVEEFSEVYRIIRAINDVRTNYTMPDSFPLSLRATIGENQKYHEEKRKKEYEEWLEQQK